MGKITNNDREYTHFSIVPARPVIYMIGARDDTHLSIPLHIHCLHLGEFRDALLAQMPPNSSVITSRRILRRWRR